MKRDMDLIREILIAVESRTPEDEERAGWFTLHGHDAAIVARHAELLHEAGLIDGRVMRSANAGLVGVQLTRLTWEGHDWLAAVRDDTVWSNTKDRITKEGVGWTFELVKAVAIAYGKAKLGPLLA
jgi:hypothetical protein